ncbi:GMC oxidoreductase [Arthrobacter crystallopoietes]|uniref:GMC oxidoreductase n=1 Tax=Crystallibacter crystallopoietes TaxID=37928 RepID=UPI0009431BFC|nr:hypothetical protein AC20117_08980 [Arthrobacter crystallopoietes]
MHCLICTVHMGPLGDGIPPLDPELRVKGVNGLHVADASVMPEHMRLSPNLTVMMIGERCSDLIRSNQSI